MVSFSGLPYELRVQIFACCSKDVCRNIALVNKECCKMVRPYIWASVTKSWRNLEKYGDVKKYKDYLKYTKEIKLTDHNRCMPLIQGYKNFMFYEILQNCSPHNMRTLRFDDFLVAGGLRLASEKLPMISSLDLCVIKKADWARMFNFKWLRELFIFHCDIMDGHFVNIGNIKTLDSLRIRRCSKLKGTLMHHISEIAPRLSTFEFEDWSNISGDYYTNALRNLKNVKLLVLVDTTNLSDSSFAPLKGNLPNITELDIRGANVGDKGLFSICTFSTLTSLYLLQFVDVTDQGLEFLCQLSSLRNLAFSGSEKVTDYGLFHISKLRKLDLLDICFDNMTDQGVAHLTKMSRLRSLDIGDNNNLTDRSLELISRTLLALEHISVTCELFTVDGLHHLLALPNLKEVEHHVEYHEYGWNISKADFQIFLSMLQSRSEV